MSAYLIATFLFVSVLGADICESIFTINARYPCIYHFYPTNCSFEMCESQLPGSYSKNTSFADCYTLCCPGMSIPTSNTTNDLARCRDYYSQTPNLVYIIAACIAFIVFLVFVILPCCATKTCLLYRFRQYVYNSLFGDQEEEEMQTLRRRKQKMMSEYLPSHNLLMAFEKISKVILVKEQIDETHTQDSLCQLCKVAGSNVRLKCGHAFHNVCLEIKNKKVPACNICGVKQVLPVRLYCGKCFRKYEETSTPNLEGSYSCKECNSN